MIAVEKHLVENTKKIYVLMWGMHMVGSANDGMEIAPIDGLDDDDIVLATLVEGKAAAGSETSRTSRA